MDGTAPPDRASPVPLYFQAATGLRAAIDAGDPAPGELLPGEAELAARLAVTRATLRRAISYLVEQGALVRERGAGIRVARPPVRRRAELTSLFDDLAAGGATPRTEVRSLRVGPLPDDVARSSGVPPGTEATLVERLRLAGDEPLALMFNAVPLRVLAPTRRELESRGLYQLLREAGHVPYTAEQVVGARAATAAEAALLGATPGAPLLTMTRISRDAGGELVEYGAHVYRADRYSVELTLTG